MALKKAKSFPIVLALTFVVTVGLGFLILRKSTNTLHCANTLSCKESLEVSVNNNEGAVFNSRNINPPKIDLSAISNEPKVLGSEAEVGEKHIEVDLTTQTLKAYEGDTLFMETKISSGKWFPTPTGDFTIWRKVRASKMSGGQGADYYYLPNVPYIMFFSNSQVAGSRGFSLHGTYWHNNFGHPMSHGCVNMRIVDAQKLYYWANPYTPENGSSSADDRPGTKITIYGKAP